MALQMDVQCLGNIQMHLCEKYIHYLLSAVHILLDDKKSAIQLGSSVFYMPLGKLVSKAEC